MPDPQAARRDAKRTKKSRRATKIVLAVVSALVMSLTGYAWAAMQGLVDGLTMADVIGPQGGGDKPADGARDILLVGNDSRTDAQGNPLSKEVLSQLRAGGDDGELNTDTLIFVHIPNDGSKAVAVSLPRDSYVDIPGGYGKHKINSAYARAKSDERSKLERQGVTDPKELELKSNQGGAKTLISTVEGVTGSTIDNYASINLLGFYDITKAVGGVDVCLNNDVNDEASGARFQAGQQTISGGDALAFVRQRHDLPRGDLDRVQRQQVFMASLANKLLSAGTLADPGKLNDLTGAVKKSVTLNQGWDILNFAQQMRNLSGGQLEFRTVPIQSMDMSTPEDGSAIQIDPREVHNFVQGLTGNQSGKPPEAQGGDAASSTTVNVRNASGATGLANSVSGILTGKGFRGGETGNSESRNSTVIQVHKGEQNVGQQIAGALGGGIDVKEDDSVPAGQANVLLGTDYSGPSDDNSQPAQNQAAEKPAEQQGGGQQPSSSGGNANEGSDEKPIKADGVTCVN